MLIQRVVTALVLLPPLLGLVWFAPTSAVYAVLCVAGLGIAWEWAGLMGLPAGGRRWAYVALTAALLALAWAGRMFWAWLAVAALAWWVASLVLLAGYPENLKGRRPGAVPMGILGQFLVVPTLLAVAVLHSMPDGALRLLYFLFLVFAADVGAFLAGRNLGRHKLAPQVSPGKTVEGAIGGLLLCAVWALTAGSYAFGAASPETVAKIVALSVVVAALSIVGDLNESMFKRIAGVKDSGTLLPGHGGVLDRVDSILAAAPAMALGVYLLGL